MSMPEKSEEKLRKDRFGFRFWLMWILTFVGAFVLSSAFWTWSMQRFFGEIKGSELMLTWVVSVFGSWILLATPFMRKKEQVWKRLNSDQEKAVDVWLGGMAFLVGGLILSTFGWAGYFREEILSFHEGLHRGWLKGTLGTWLFLMMPVLVVMYRQSDRIFKDANYRQGFEERTFRSVAVDSSERWLPTEMAKRLRKVRETLRGGHLVRVFLRDGREIPHVFVRERKEILGIYDHQDWDFCSQDIENIEVMNQDEIPAYEENRWMRLDGKR